MTQARTAMIIGSGIAGSVAALALHRAGIEPTVFEAYDRPSDDVGGELMLAPNGIDALGIVGVEDDVHRLGSPIRRTVMTDGRGRPFGDFEHLPDLPPSRAVKRADLQRLLRERTEAAGVRIVYGRRLVGATDSPDSITANFADGSSATADVLIGADGIRSAVRRLIDPGAPTAQYTGMLGLGGAVEVPSVGEPGVMHLANGHDAFFGHWIGSDGRVNWFSNITSDEPMAMSEARRVPADRWLNRLRRVHAEDVPAREVLDRAGPQDVFPFGAIEILPPLRTWYRGRMVLVGDAAHAPSPVSGQGASLASESAVQLARCLRDVPGVQAAFATYEMMRRPRVEKIAADAARANQAKAPGPVAYALMRLLAPVARHTVLKPERMFGPVHRHRIDWNRTVTPA
ncbi:FAD-dependent oxidoreductase [Micromonospora sp. NPDC005553]|uniref:FAD-dependent oxidoreductase n=1 Tax=Micromonospora sp. NPDC005553 TaxID=3364232 RepID=UPI0036815E7E